MKKRYEILARVNGTDWKVGEVDAFTPSHALTYARRLEEWPQVPREVPIIVMEKILTLTDAA